MISLLRALLAAIVLFESLRWKLDVRHFVDPISIDLAFASISLSLPFAEACLGAELSSVVVCH